MSITFLSELIMICSILIVLISFKLFPTKKANDQSPLKLELGPIIGIIGILILAVMILFFSMGIYAKPRAQSSPQNSPIVETVPDSTNP